MGRLIERSPLAGHVPVAHGTCGLAEGAAGPVTSVAPFPGKAAALSKAMVKAHGVAFPAPNRVNAAGDVRAVWSGRDQCFLIGAAPAEALAAHAALTDQSDGWALLLLNGAGAEAVLARLVPLDLRPGSFAVGHSARSQIGHVMALIERREAGFALMVMRSFAATVWHELEEAMKGVAARG